jgi:hypothetical protein
MRDIRQDIHMNSLSEGQKMYLSKVKKKNTYQDCKILTP